MSTDPAHSLGDALGVNLVPGELTPIPGVPMMPDGDGCLYALEVDVTEAVDEFKSLVRGFAQTSAGSEGAFSR